MSVSATAPAVRSKYSGRRAGPDPSGHVILCVNSGIASISRLAVARAARRVGVGGALFDTACDHAAGRGLQPVLEVVETNTAAMALYESRGWYRLGSERWSDGETLLLHHYAAPQR